MAPKIMLLLLLMSSGVSAQSAPAKPHPGGLEVVEKSWRKEIRNPALDSDPFEANDAHEDFKREQRETEIRNTIRAREGDSRQRDLPRIKPMKTKETNSPYVQYIYRLKIRNAAEKAISALVWEYRFLDQQSLEEVGRHSFTHRVKIRPGKEIELIGLSASPPVRVIDARKSGNSPIARYSENIVVQRIEYADGSVLLNPTK